MGWHLSDVVNIYVIIKKSFSVLYFYNNMIFGNVKIKREGGVKRYVWKKSFKMKVWSLTL